MILSLLSEERRHVPFKLTLYMTSTFRLDLKRKWEPVVRTVELFSWIFTVQLFYFRLTERDRIGHFRITLNLSLKTQYSVKPVVTESFFYSYANHSHFYKKSFAIGLALKVGVI